MGAEVEHPYEDRILLQGTTLPESVAPELEDMQHHAALLAAAADLAALFADARAYRAQLVARSISRLPRCAEAAAPA